MNSQAIINELKQAIASNSYRGVQKHLKAWRTKGYEVRVALNKKKDILMSEAQRVIEAYEQRTGQSQPVESVAQMPYIDPDRVLRLGDWVGNAHYQVLQAIAVQETVKTNRLYESLYQRCKELTLEISDRWRDLQEDSDIVGLG